MGSACTGQFWGGGCLVMPVLGGLQETNPEAKLFECSLSQFAPMAVPPMLQTPGFGQEGQSVGPPYCWDGMRGV